MTREVCNLNIGQGGKDETSLELVQGQCRRWGCWRLEVMHRLSPLLQFSRRKLGRDCLYRNLSLELQMISSIPGLSRCTGNGICLFPGINHKSEYSDSDSQLPREILFFSNIGHNMVPTSSLHFWKSMFTKFQGTQAQRSCGSHVLFCYPCTASPVGPRGPAWRGFF